MVGKSARRKLAIRPLSFSLSHIIRNDRGTIFRKQSRAANLRDQHTHSTCSLALSAKSEFALSLLDTVTRSMLFMLAPAKNSQLSQRNAHSHSLRHSLKSCKIKRRRRKNAEKYLGKTHACEGNFFHRHCCVFVPHNDNMSQK